MLDFGIAKLVNEQGESNITKTGMICGTPQYLSPEQVLGNKPSPASDLYSLGIVLYEMLSGQPPFYSPTPMKLLMKHLNEIPEPVSVKNPDVAVPPSFNEFLKRSLQKDPADRFASVEEFRLALELAMEKAEKSGDVENIQGIATTAAGLRTLSAEDADKVSSAGQTVVQGTDPDVEAARSGGAIVDTSSGLHTMQGDEFDEPTELVGAHSSKKGLFIGVGVVAVLLIAVLFAWKPWMGAAPAEKKEDSAAASKADEVPAKQGQKSSPADEQVEPAAATPDVVSVADIVAEVVIEKVEQRPDVMAAKPEDIVALRPDLKPEVAAAKPDVSPPPAQDVQPQKPDVVEVK